jgi:hypothetical protein
VVLVLAVCVGVRASTAVSQDWLPEGSVTGNLSSVSGDLLTLLDGMISVEASSARVALQSGMAQLKDLKPGMLVTITVRVKRKGDIAKLVAEDIFELPQKEPFEAALSGNVQAIDSKGTLITVLTVPAALRADTEFKNLSTASAIQTIREIAVGSRVIVWLKKQGTGLVATMVYLDDTIAVPDKRVVGNVLAVAEKQWRIRADDGSEVTVLIDKDTRFGDAAGKGDKVLVLAITQEDNSLLAYLISKWPPTH